MEIGHNIFHHQKNVCLAYNFSQWLAFRQADGCLAPSVLDVRHMKVVEMSHMKGTALNRIKCVGMYKS